MNLKSLLKAMQNNNQGGLKATPLALLFIFFFTILILPKTGSTKVRRIGESLCRQNGYHCLEVAKGDSWKSLWPDAAQRDVVRRVNRMNIRLRPGMVLAVPQDLGTATLKELAPLPLRIEPPGTREIQVDLDQLAWGAYDPEGNLVKWGPAVGGKSWCPDVARPCLTRTGQYEIIRKGGAGCKSKKFPVPDGGAPMPYCMFYSGGYALHGSYNVPGYHASHGCVRLFPEDAKWLNREFAKPQPEGDLMVNIPIRLLPYQ